jgi:hypothetical protein
MIYFIVPLIVVAIFIILFLYNFAGLKIINKSVEVIGRVYFPERKIEDFVVYKDSYVLFVSFLFQEKVITLCVTEEGFNLFKPGDTISISYRKCRITENLITLSYPHMVKDEVYKIN